MTAVLKIGLIGAGTMGALHARVIATSPRTQLAWVHDRNPATGRTIAERHSSRYVHEVDLSSVDAVVVAAPTQFHHEVGLAVLQSRTPMLMEKPLADTIDEVDSLLQEAERQDTPIMCGLLERFNPAVRTAFDLSRSPVHFRSTRHSPMTDRIQTGVAGDLLIHDLDLAIRLFGEMPTAAIGLTDRTGELDGGVEDIVEALLRFGTYGVGSLSASRRSQRKIRSMRIAEADRMIEIDLLRQDVTIYRHVLESPTDDDLGYRQQTIIDVPVLRYHGEPLMMQLDHFVDLVAGTGDHRLERETIRPPHEVLHSLSISTSP
jgi:predicted dehydrogenase